MQLTGVVVQLEGEWADVQVAPLAGCASCGKCTLGQAPKIPQVRAYNSVGAVPGDQVVMEMDPRGVVAASAWLYLLPIIFLLAGLGVGYTLGGDGIALFMGVLGLGLSLLVLRLGDSRWSRNRAAAAEILEKCDIQNTI